MSYSRVETRGRRVTQRLGWFARAASVIVWAVINAALLFAEYVAELLAPLLLISGGLWWAIPKGLAALRLDGPANDILQQIRAQVPLDVFVGGDAYNAHTLIYDGIGCIAVVAICRTLSSLLTHLLLERP